MIVRDEERHLPDCLSSLRGIVDELVIVDTGSVDATVAIAESYGARVLHQQWTGDFSAPRNLGLEAATGRWILYIDADERLEPVERAHVEALLEDADEVAFRIGLRPFVGWTPYLEYRLWRSDPRIRFRGVIHEKVVYAIDEVAVADDLEISDCDFLVLDHVGYEGDQTHKHERNLPLLQAQLAAEPGSTFNWTHLGRVLRGLGRVEEAEEAFARAVALARAYHDPHGGVAFSELLAFRYTRGEQLDDLLAEGRARWPDNMSMVWLEGHRHLEEGRNEQALACLTELVDFDPAAPGPVSYDNRLFGAETHASMGLALFRLGRYSEAAAMYAVAEQMAPAATEYRVKRLLAEGRAAQEVAQSPS
ncbi:MAG: glycosyltransferase [Acidimicrobiales bacterium]|nr:glycosyltransferase [Acidimicrobiales bacterium]